MEKYDVRNYIADAHRTAPEQNRLVIHDEFRHGVHGVVTESAELIHKLMIKAPDEDVLNELGDLNWYVALILHSFGKDYYTHFLDLKMSDIPLYYRELVVTNFQVVENNLPRKYSKKRIIALLAIASGGLMDLIKKNDAYEKPYTWDQVLESLAIISYCNSAICLEYVFEPYDVCGSNIEKLLKRFPEKFDANLAINKNVEAESEVFKSAIKD